MTCVQECHESWHLHAPGSECHHCDPCELEPSRIDAVYAERNQLVAALSKVYPSHLCRHEGADWEDDWRNIVCVHLPTGQATWHIHDNDLIGFGHLEPGPNHWDGHSTDEKYDRLRAL